MALTRTQSVVTYSSSSGGVTYYFDVLVDSANLVSVRNIRGPLGLIQDATTGVPQTVWDDINEAREAVLQVLSETQVDSGNLVFNGVTSVAAVIAGGVVNNTNYRVVYTTPDGTVLRTQAGSKTTTAFTAEAPTTYGTGAAPVTVTYVVLVATQQASTQSGVETFAFADTSIRAVTFTTALSSAAYRVVFEPSDFFPVRILPGSQTRQGFTIEIGRTLQDNGETVTVGYDVFIG